MRHAVIKCSTLLSSKDPRRTKGGKQASAELLEMVTLCEAKVAPFPSLQMPS